MNLFLQIPCLLLALVLGLGACGKEKSTKDKDDGPTKVEGDDGDDLQADDDADDADGSEGDDDTTGTDDGGEGDGGEDDGAGDPVDPVEPVTGTKVVMGALGDSVSAGLNSLEFFVESTEVVWSTGDKPAVSGGSHYVKFRDILGVETIEVNNVARSGDTSLGLNSQVKRLLEGETPDYLSVLIGANDVCGWPVDHAEALQGFRERVGDAIDAVIDANGGVRVVLSSVPSLNQLHELKKDEASCQQIWDFAGFCQLLLSVDATEEDRAAFEERWEDMNAALGDIAAERQQHVRYRPEVAATQLKEEDISPHDCFHPSGKGQGLIAEKTWDKEWAKGAVK